MQVNVGDVAPLFSTATSEGKTFDLSSRKGQGWTVLFFYPKAETPGCTKQACAFRDSIGKIRAVGAEVFGISADTVEAQAKFREHHHLAFTLLADPDAKIIEKYGVKMPLLKMSKRWTFILDKELKVRSIDKDVDPVLDPDRVVTQISSF
jgi:peroxiredoxin Q/BCP